MFKRLIKLVRQEKVSLFLGSGFSLEAEAPSVNALKSAILREFDDENLISQHTNDCLAGLSDFFVKKICLGSRNDLIRIMKDQFDFSPICLDDHKLLASIPHFKTIFTTNYDTLIEDSYEHDKIQVVRKDKDYTYFEQDKTTVFKVHGDFNDPDSVVITSTDYENFKKHPNPLMWDKVKEEFTSKYILFIGYSLEDSNILNTIKRIRRSVGRNQKEMFLIAPSLPVNKQQQLSKNGVCYIDALASDFLTVLSKEIADNIFDDFRHHQVSLQTYSEYCHNHKYDPTVTVVQNGDNRIEKINPFPGHPLKHKIDFTVKSELKNILENPDFDKYGKPMQGTCFENVPCIRLSSDQLLKCSHSINDVVYSKNIKEIIIGPVLQKLKLKLKILDSDFFEQVEVDAYRLNNHKILMIADCHIYNITITITYNDNLTKTINFRFDFKNSYSDNDLALKWIEFPIAFFSDKKISIPEIFDQPISYMTGQSLSDNHFSDFRMYYQNVKFIEREIEDKFDHYEGCTEETFNNVRIVSAFLKHKIISEINQNGKGFSVSGRGMSYNKFNNKIKINEPLSIVSTDKTPKIISINEKKFTIPYAHYIYNNCIVKNMIPNGDNELHVDFVYDNYYYYVLYSKQSAEIEFPELKPFLEL